MSNHEAKGVWTGSPPPEEPSKLWVPGIDDEIVEAEQAKAIAPIASSMLACEFQEHLLGA